MEKFPRVSRNYKKCVICNRRRTPGSNVYLARLPLEPDRCQKWVKAIGQEDLLYLPVEKLHDLKFVCNEHFKSEDFNESRNRLLSHAVPTLNLPLKPLEDNLFEDFPLHIGQYSKRGSSESHPGNKVDKNENVSESMPSTSSLVQTSPQHEKPRGSSESHPGNKVDKNENTSESMPSTSSQYKCFPVQTSPQHEKPNILKDITNLDSEGLRTTLASKRKSDMLDSIEEPGPSTAEVNVQSHKRKKRSNVSKCLNAREEKLLLKLKAQKLTLKKLAKTSLDLDKLDNAVLKNLVNDVAKNHQKKSSGKRWTMRTKLWALAIFKRSPKAYRYLEWAMSVPSVKTLQRLLSSVPLEPGINKKLILKCSEMFSGLSEQDKFCSLLFDEMSLKKRLIYNEASDQIEGFEDYGGERSSKIADHALVFMVQGLKKKFKLPIAHYFIQGTISSSKLCVIIKNVISSLEEVGFKILTTVCDQGPTNVGALNMLKRFGGQSPEDNYFISDEHKKVCIMFDIPHLFKSIRNNFYNAGEIVWDGKLGKWSHLIEAEEKNRNFLNFTKLNKTVVHPTFKTKMRVKYAAHALSNTTSAILRMLSWKHDNSIEISETADIIKELDNLFDVCNGPSSPKDVKKGIRENVSSKTNHIEMWKYFSKKIATVKFLKSDSKLQLNHVRCIKGFVISLKTLGDIWNTLEKQGFKYLNLRQLNQDSLENLFGMIRQHNVTNRNPTCTHFTAAIKTCILSGLTAPHSRGSNCEADSNRFFFDYENMKTVINEDLEQPQPLASTSSATENVPVLSLPDEIEDVPLENLSTFRDQPVVYVSGYLASTLSKNDCVDCKHSLTVESPNNEIYKYITLREWWKDKQSLTYPSIGLCQTVYTAKTIFEKMENQFKNNISKICLLEFNIHCDLSWFTCTKHFELRETLLKRISMLFIRKFCKLTNEKFSMTESDTIDKYKKAQIQSKA